MATAAGATAAGGGDWALAAEVFRRYDADGSGRLDRDELLATLRDLGLLTRVSAAAAGRALAEMDANGDGVVSFEEFRKAFSQLAKLRAAEQRVARVQKAAPVLPPNAATDPRLRAAFHLFASYGAAKGLADHDSGLRGGDKAQEGLTSRQFQRACTVAGLPVERAAVDVIFTIARRGAKKLSFPRFLEGLAQVSAEASMPLEAVLDSMRAAAPAAAVSPAKDVDSKLPLSARSGARRPKSASLVKPGAAAGLVLPPERCAASSRGGSAAAMAAPASSCPLKMPAVAAASMAAPGTVPAPGTTPSLPYSKLQQRVATLQQLLEFGLDDEREEGGGSSDSILAHPGSLPAPQEAAAEAAGVQQAQGGGVGGGADETWLNPTYQAGQDGGDPALASLRLDLLSLVDQRCEAAEARCAALVATRAEMTRALVAQVGGAAGSASAAAAHELWAAMAGYEARLAALDQRLGDAVAAATQECRAAATAVDAKMAAAQRAQDEALGRVNQALLAIARRVGSLAAQPEGMKEWAGLKA